MHPTAMTCTAILGILLYSLGLSVPMLRFRDKQLAGPALCVTRLHTI